MDRSNIEKNAIPLGNIFLMDIFYQIIILVVNYILLGGFKLGDKVLGVLVVNAKRTRCRYVRELILNYTREF